MKPAVGGFEVGFRGKDASARIFTSICDCPIYEPSDDPTKIARVELLSTESGIEGGVGAVLEGETLVVCEAELWYCVSVLVDGVLLHDVHGGYQNSGDEVYLVERQRKAETVNYIVGNQFTEECVVGFCSLVISEGKCFPDVRLSFLD